MRLYAAPLEGVTGFLYRRAHRECFPGLSRYYIPFIAPKKTGRFTTREKNDIATERNAGVPAIPQVLTNDAAQFLHTTELLAELGYREVNLNLGCPSPTVVTKGKGAGLLGDPERLDRLLEEIFGSSVLPVSIKTRAGLTSFEEAEKLLVVYNRYPICELILHPRRQKDGYRGEANREVYAHWLKESRNPLCYNGDIFTKGDYDRLLKDYPETRAVMLGRGLQSNPALHREIMGGAPLNKEELFSFSERLTEDYAGYFQTEKTLLYKLKEMWFYEARMFSGYEPYLKKIQKSSTRSECQMIVAALFREQELLPTGSYRPTHGGKMP